MVQFAAFHCPGALCQRSSQRPSYALRLSVGLTEVLMNQEVLTEKLDGSSETLLEMQERLAAIVGKPRTAGTYRRRGRRLRPPS